MFKEFNFKINVPSSTWVIEHNFGAAVNADVFVNLGANLQKAYPDTMVQDAARNILTVSWNSPQSGGARVVTMNTDTVNTLNPTWIPDDASNMLRGVMTEDENVVTSEAGDRLSF